MQTTEPVTQPRQKTSNAKQKQRNRIPVESSGLLSQRYKGNNVTAKELISAHDETVQPGAGGNYENEADRFASSVMKGSGSITRLPSRRRPDNGVALGSTYKPKSVLQQSGQPLPPVTQMFFEQGFGHDFSGIRIHNSLSAARTAESINARAFTLGSDIAFARDQYVPGSSDGRRLIAHELAHSLQQRKIGRRIQRFAFTEPDSECPSRVSGEQPRAASGPMVVERQAGSIDGLLVGNFTIGSSAVKPGLAANALWKSFTAAMGAGTHSDWDILGYSDCLGGAKVNTPLRAQRAEAVYQALPANAKSKVNSRRGAPLQESMVSNADEAGRAKNRAALIWTTLVNKPASKPALAKVKDVFAVSKCGKVKPGMPAAQADAIRACLAHSSFVNAMNQAIANMRQVPTPYAAGLANVYAALLKQVIAAGQSSYPVSGSPKTYSVKNIKVRLSAKNTITVPSVSLKLTQQGTAAANGSYLGGVIMLNETSTAAFSAMYMGKDSEVERVMYAEGFHFISGEVSSANRNARRKTPRGKLIREELDVELTRAYKNGFITTVQPYWEQVLRKYSTVAPADISKKAAAQAGLHWFKVNNEITDRLEEALYLAGRAGNAFTGASLNGMQQGWAVNAAYWAPFLVSEKQMQTFINSKRVEIYDKIVPIVINIQKAYLRARPAN